jgi:hypothetical protein
LGEVSPYWEMIYFGQFFKYRSITKIWATFFTREKLCITFDKKWAWATFWAIFSQTHLVTLFEME